MKLVDVAPELAYFGVLNMCNNKLTVSLKCNNPTFALRTATNASSATTAKNKLSTTASYKITDLCVYSRQLLVKPGMQQALKAM